MKPQGDWKESKSRFLYSEVRIFNYVIFSEDDDAKVGSWLHSQVGLLYSVIKFVTFSLTLTQRLMGERTSAHVHNQN